MCETVLELLLMDTVGMFCTDTACRFSVRPAKFRMQAETALSLFVVTRDMLSLKADDV